MGDWNLGSVHDTVLDLVDDVPANISGARLLEMADRKREYVENYTGNSIGSNSIQIQYQDIIVNMTAAQVTKTMMTTGVDADSVRLGDFTIKKGSNSNLSAAAKNWEEMAKEQLKSLGRRVSYFKALG